MIRTNFDYRKQSTPFKGEVFKKPMQRTAVASLRLFFSSENYIRALPLNPVGGGRQHPTFEAKSRQKPPEGFRSPQTPANGSCGKPLK